MARWHVVLKVCGWNTVISVEAKGKEEAIVAARERADFRFGARNVGELVSVYGGHEDGQ